MERLASTCPATVSVAELVNTREPPVAAEDRRKGIAVRGNGRPRAPRNEDIRSAQSIVEEGVDMARSVGDARYEVPRATRERDPAGVRAHRRARRDGISIPVVTGDTAAWLTRTEERLRRSKRKTSVAPLPSMHCPGTRFVARLRYAMKRPSSLMARA